MALMSPTDSLFLIAEKRENPMHVGGLQLFSLPEGCGPDYVNEAYHRMIEFDDLQPRFRLRPRRPLTSLGQWTWTVDDDVDLEYHGRLSALPRPGRVRELLELTSRLHGSLLDRRRPLWEYHIIEGLTGNRFATYSKMHHALIDGVSALRLLSDTLSEDPADLNVPPPWAARARRARSSRPQPDGDQDLLGGAIRAVQAVAHTAGQLAGATQALVRAVNEGLREQTTPLPLQAPRSIFNVPITGARRFAAQSWPFDRVRPVRTALGGTVNDIVLAMCAGALRRYLMERGALPDRPLVAMVPVSLRTPASGHDPAGNAVGTILCNLGTHLDDPAQRYELIRTSMARGKRIFAGLTPLQVTVLSALVMAPMAASPLPGVIQYTPPAFNLVISNVPGPTRPLYWNGARLQGVYPLSIPIDGQALNITATSYAGSVEFGLTGCRRNVPHLQRLLGHLDTSLAELEKLVS
ncbi:MAG TPA: wax ester/triacylglycerol synthase family O-acyltransferase [Pseudonocardiaceae bacterium]|nr:wax ester/triacylglycerol synthase family O-acyltransferase [Pseudonocardiaceae bacterium]